MITDKIQLMIKDKTFTVSLDDNKAVKELVEILKEKDLTLTLSDYGGFEKVGSLGKRLTTSNKHITTNAGDIVLYNGDQIVIFYGSNTWSYTKLGKVDNLSEWSKVLGDSYIEITFSIKK